MATYTGRSKITGSVTHLLIGDGYHRYSLCGLRISTQSLSWVWTKLLVKEGERLPFEPVTCKRCLLVLMGRAWDKWDWSYVEEEG